MQQLSASIVGSKDVAFVAGVRQDLVAKAEAVKEEVNFIYGQFDIILIFSYLNMMFFCS